MADFTDDQIVAYQQALIAFYNENKSLRRDDVIRISNILNTLDIDTDELLAVYNYYIKPITTGTISNSDYLIDKIPF
jgi:hypothetical protein